MKGLGRKASFLAVVAVLATAVMGSAYSLWFEKLTATTNITTSSLDAKIICGAVSDNEPLAPGQHWDTAEPFFAAYPVANPLKDVAKLTYPANPNQHIFQLAVDDAYPGYALDCEVEVFNTASLPWHLEDMKVKVLECDANGLNCVPVVSPSGQVYQCDLSGQNCVLVPGPWQMQCLGGFMTTCIWGNLGINPPNFPAGLDNWSPIYVDVPQSSFQGCQVHKGDAALSGSVHIGVNQSAKQNTRYKIVIEYQVNQWNESSYTGYCGQLKPGYTGPTLSQLQ